MSRQPQRLVLPPSLPVRLAVVLLALLQFVAPTWHVCALGGHVMPSGEQMAMHHGGSAAQEQPDEPQRPLICYCAPKEEHSGGSQLSPIASHGEHMTCLALLLQTMPGQTAALPIIFSSFSVTHISYSVRREKPPVLAHLHYFRGRAPPLSA